MISLDKRTPRMISLTLTDPDNPQVLINPAQVVTVKPRKGYKPDVASQKGGTLPYWTGAEITLTNGSHLNVSESVSQVLDKLAGDEPGQDANKLPAAEPAPRGPGRPKKAAPETPTPLDDQAS